MNLQAVARVYESSPSIPQDETTRRVYAVFARECAYQFRAILETGGLNVRFVDVDPYKSSMEMFKDIAENNTLRVFTGGEAHPVWTREENSTFRAVHDYFGHYMTGSGFGPTGETEAWKAHRAMFSIVARPALDVETIGQVAVYFAGSKPKQYAEQKAFLFPSEVLA